MGNTVIICAHPDDAVIFCGGTILKEAEAKTSKVHIISLTGPNNDTEASEIKMYSEVAKCGFETLGYKSSSNFSHIDIVPKLSSLLQQLTPKTLLTHWPKDTHFGHTETYHMVSKALLSYSLVTNGKIPLDFFCFDTYWSRGCDLSLFSPSILIDISDVWEHKKSHIEIFQNDYLQTWLEMADIMNKINGRRSGVRYAEGFLKQSSFASLNGGERAYQNLP